MDLVERGARGGWPREKKNLLERFAIFLFSFVTFFFFCLVTACCSSHHSHFSVILYCSCCHQKKKVANVFQGRREREREQESSPEQPDFANLDRRSSRRSSSSPGKSRHVDEDDYIKIAGSHKMRRVRQTVYCDPGNPFELEASEADFDDILLPRSKGASPAFTDSSGFNPELRRSVWHSSSPVAETDSSDFIFEFEHSPVHHSPVHHSPVSSSYSSSDSVLHRRGSPDVGMERFSGKGDLPLHAPKARRPGTPALVRAHSLQEALVDTITTTTTTATTTVVSAPEADDVYIPPRSLWRRSLPSNNLLEATGHVNDVRRDSKFYGFYDGVLEEYRVGLKETDGLRRL